MTKEELYPNAKFYGPYLFEDGRQRLTLVYPDDSRHCIQYAKLLIELKLGRRLTDNEEVDHKDDNKFNDDIDNLQVIDRLIHREIHSTYYFKDKEFICPRC